MKMHLGDERARRVDRVQLFVLRGLPHRRRDAMRGENYRRAVGHFIELFDEHRAAPAKLIDDVAVVDDFLSNVDGPVDDLQRLFDDGDRAHDARAESAEAGDQQLLVAHQVIVSFCATTLRRTRG
jgi:hypothetical protein